MSYTLQQIYEALGKVENGGAMVADLQDAISAARNEAAASRVAKNKVLDALGLRGEDNDDALKNLSETLKALRQAGNPETLGSQIAAMQSQIKGSGINVWRPPGRQRCRRLSRRGTRSIRNPW